MQFILSGIQSINQFLWSGPLLFLLMGTHLYFTMKLRFPQKNILRAIKLSVTPAAGQSGNNLSVFATLATTLAATRKYHRCVHGSGLRRTRGNFLVLDHRYFRYGHRLCRVLLKRPIPQPRKRRYLSGRADVCMEKRFT